MKFQYNPEVSLGNIIQVIAILGSVAAAYTALQNADIRHDQELIAQAAQIKDLKERQENLQRDIKSEIKDMSNGIAVLNDKITNMLIENARAHKSK